MRLLFCLTLLLLSINVSYSQNIWLTSATSDGTSESMDVVIDNSGNTYTVGYISGDTEFQAIQINMNLGYSDVVVTKINPLGEYVWVKKFTGPLSDKGIKIALTKNNDIIITGTYYKSITFDAITLTSQNQSKDIFLTRLNNNGDVIWARTDGGAMGDNVYGLALDTQDNVVLTGQFEGTSTIAGQSFTSMIDPSTLLPAFDIFLAKFDPNGNPLWSKASYAEYEDRGMAVVCDKSNNIYLTGQFSDTINFFGQTINNQIYNAGFVSKFDPNGTNKWFDKLAAGQVLAYDIDIDNQGKLVVTGDFLGQLVIWASDNLHTLNNPYSNKIFVLKLDSQGNYIWAKANGSNSEVSSRAVCIDSQDDIYITGHFKCNFDQHRDSTGTAHWQSAGFRDIFVTKFKSNGSSVWKNQVGGQMQEQSWGIDIKDDDYPIFTGSYQLNLTHSFDINYNYLANISNQLKQVYTGTYDSDSDSANHVFILGDSSINIFASKMVSSNSHYFNYYNHNSLSNINDSIPMLIIPDKDSVDFCPPDRACVRTNTNYFYGPLYKGTWNTGDQWNWCVDGQERDGLYSVFVERQDGCYNFDDTIYIDYHPAPPMPFLTDDHGVNTNTDIYNDIIACAPDTLNFFFQNLCIGCSATISINSSVLNDSLILDSNYQTSVNSSIAINVVSDFGCVSYEGFRFILLEDIKPYLILEDLYDKNDSIMICKGNPVRVIIADSITNPNRALFPHPELVNSASVTFTFNGQNIGGSTDGHYSDFYPNQTGWYVINQNLSVGINTCLKSYQLVDSYYVEIKESPNLTFVGGELLCPDSYNFLSVSPVIPNLTWSGPAILWTSNDNDSIKLNESGWYGVTGFYDYGEVSCPFSASVEIKEKAPPNIIMNPVDGIVCPGDSVLLSLSETGYSYEWIGPEGAAISLEASVYVFDQGFYACIFTDTQGCQLLTAQAEVREYTSPFIELSPTNVVCEMEDITLTAIHGGLATILWHQPINSTSESVVVNQAGTYCCDFSQCGMTVIDSVTIIDGSFQLAITSSTTNLCDGDTIRINATNGLNIYQWSNGFYGLSFLDVTQAGTYSLQAWNQYGCTDTSNSITINTFPESFAPLVNDTFVCVGANVTLNYSSNFGFGWYNSMSDPSPFSTSDSVSYTNVMTDFSVFIAHNSTNCPLHFKEVKVEVLMPLTPPPILGDTTVCIGEDVVLSVNPITNGHYFWIYAGDTVSTNSSVTINNIQLNDSISFQILMDDGCSNTSNSIQISLKIPSPISVSESTDTLCYGENLSASASGSGNTQFIWTDGTNLWNTASINLSYFEIASNQLTVFGINADDCHSDTLTLDLTFSKDASLDIEVSDLTCFNNLVEITASDSLGTLFWTLPNGKVDTINSLVFQNITFDNKGLYIANLLNQYACLISDSVEINVLDLPYFNPIPDSTLCSEGAYSIQFPTNNYSFVWNDSISNSVFTPNGIDPAILTAIDSNGCRFSDTIQITLVDCSGKAANVITNNGDGINEFFTVFNAQYSYDNCILILNRWGNVVYEQQYYQNTFNGYTNEGKKLNDGVYFFLYYRDCNLKKEITHQGFFQIISGE